MQQALCVGHRAGGNFLSALSRVSFVCAIMLLVLTAVAGCSRPGPSEGGSSSSQQVASPQSSLSAIRGAMLVPNPVVRNTPITVVLEKNEVPDQTLSYRYEWFVNRVAVQGLSSPSLDPSMLRRGDVVYADVIVSNDTGARASYRTPWVTVSNTLPVIKSVVIEQDLSQRSRRLLAKVDAFDADQDDLQYVFRWLRNNKVVAEGADNVFEVTDVAQNDLVTVEVIPHDRDGAGMPVRATPLVSGNNPPKILSTPMMMANTESYEYAVEAKDSDGDVVIFELETAPEGMSIDRASGRLTWKLSPVIQGTHHVKVIALDGKGGRTWQEFDLSVPTSVPSPQETPRSS